jgi:hypothetical protein
MAEGGERWDSESAIRDPQSSEARPRVLDLDDLTEGEKQDALAACDVLCVPSEGELFGMVYFEAWALREAGGGAGFTGVARNGWSIPSGNLGE